MLYGFLHNVKSRVKEKFGTGYLSSEEFDNSEALWLTYEQRFNYV